MRSQSIGFMPVILSSHPAPILPVNKAAGRPWEAAWMPGPLLIWFGLVYGSGRKPSKYQPNNHCKNFYRVSRNWGLGLEYHMLLPAEKALSEQALNAKLSIRGPKSGKIVLKMFFFYLIECMDYNKFWF